MMVETEATVDEAITNTETVEALRHTLDTTPDAHDRDVSLGL